MKIGVPKETAAGERRVAMVPEVIEKSRRHALQRHCNWPVGLRQA